jgi:hypothetical protein
MLTAQVVAAFKGIPDGLVSLGIGLWAVVLARWVFVNRENRRLPRKQPWRETLPLTLVAMLVAAVLIIDRRLGLSAAAFTGLGVGWAAVLLLDIFGERITAALRAGFAVSVPERARLIADKSLEGGDMGNSADIPDDMVRSIDKLGDVPGVYDRD